MTFATRTDLMAHQREAVAKLLPSRVGALFMDMGTGKSRTAIELARVRLAAWKIDRVIWVVPVSVKHKIADEIVKHTDCGRDRICVFDDNITDADQPAAFWCIVGLESVSQSSRVTLALGALITERCMLIVDESGYIKNERSNRARRLTLLGERARYRLILTGTPITQGVEDLYAQMKFLSPKILGYRSWWAFKTHHLRYSDKFPGLIQQRCNTGYLAAKIAPYTYQVTRDECMDLPSKIHVERSCALSADQRAAYDDAKERFLQMSADIEDWSNLAIYRLFTALQTIVCGFEKVGDRCNMYSDYRVVAVLGVIDEAPAGDKIVIWCRYRRPLALIVRALTARYGADQVAELHGGIAERDRKSEIARWQERARFLVATQSVGGHGLDMIEARTVIFHSDGFKYADRIQAEDRSHRYGQTQRVTYVTISAECGIDERIQTALARKSNALSDFRSEVDAVKGRGRSAAHALVRAL